jgi:hypothetical protein
MKRKLQIVVLTLAGFFLVLVILKMPFVSKAMTNILPALAATKEPIDPYIGQIESYQDELRRTDLSNETQNLIREKLRIASLMATQWAEGKLNQPAREFSLLATPPIDVAGIKLPDGIDNHPSVPFSEYEVTVLNSWRKTADNHYYLVYAGFLTHDPQQGAILVYHRSTHDFEQYNTPEKSGGVRVIEEKGAIIVLQSTKGNLFYFDAAREQFVDADGILVVTNTPLPPTPTPFVIYTQTPSSPYP